MKNIAHITGTSSGIGKAIAETLLEKGWQVFGYSRRENIQHSNYRHFSLDLSNADAVADFNFEQGLDEAQKVVLINNAAQAEPVKKLGALPVEEFLKGVALNLSVPVLLMNRFLENSANREVEKVIINISTGAAKYPVKGWTLYCSTKAALDMATRVAVAENTDKQCRIFAVAPGIVDTEMQDAIREADPGHFPRLPEFKAYKEQKKLKDPYEVAKAYVQILEHPERFSEVIFAV